MHFPLKSYGTKILLGSKRIPHPDTQLGSWSPIIPWELLDFLGVLSFFVSLFVLRQSLIVPPLLVWNLLGKPGWPQTHRDLPTSFSKVLGWKTCISKSSSTYHFLPTHLIPSLSSHLNISTSPPLCHFTVSAHCPFYAQSWSQLYTKVSFSPCYNNPE